MAEYYFNFPSIASLTISQQSALDCPNAIALSGGPGTGKSFVSLWRHISNHEKAEPILSELLTFTTSLAFYLRASSASINKTAGQYVESTNNWYYYHRTKRSEIIVDEAQDMPISFYKDNLLQYSEKISYGADDKQILQSGAALHNRYDIDKCSPEAELKEIFKNEVFILDENFRNTKRILEFAKTTFEQAVIPSNELDSCKELGSKPNLFITGGDIKKQNDTLINLIKQFSDDITHNIGILTPLASKPWYGGETLTAEYYYELLKDDFDVSFYDNRQHGESGLRSMKTIHITTFKSAKGLQFDTVIIPCFDSYQKSFKVINWRDFFVGVTRARSNLYLFSANRILALDSVVKNKELNETLDLGHTEIDDLPF